MAGPGGGPPRRSHTKSRKGCETCKRRHIRCDENFPQCRNCTKHKIRCPYNDMPPTEERSASPEKPDLLWTPEIESAIEQWRVTGLFPFPSLNIYPAPDPQSLTREELRLIYHVAEISHQLITINANEFTLWTRQIPTIIQIGASHRYVLHALLAFSAMHITFWNECPMVGNMVYEYRGIALKGLHEAIGCFSRETSDAVLAASLVLSWQATDWRSWTQHMQGTSSVIDAIQRDGWKDESHFRDFIAESSTFPTAPPSPTPDHKPSQPRKEDLAAFERTFQQVQSVEAHLKHMGEDTTQFVRLINFLKGVRKVSPSLSVAQQFDRLQPLRKWVLWLPVFYLQQTGGSPSALLTIAHYYTVALLMERLFPEIGAAYFGSLTMAPVEAIYQRLLLIQNTAGLEAEQQAMMSTVLSFMEFPLETLNEFRSRMGLLQPPVWPSFQQFVPANFYTTADSPMEMPPTTSEFLPYGDNPAFSYSTEDLSVITGDSGPNSAISPLQLSPFTNPQYLSIPSPSYGGHSPTSSNYGDFDTASVGVYSDHEDFVTYDMGFSGTTPMLGGSSSYGVGFVPQLPTVWT
ncbi:hypothetical protein BR93DRAFT_936515 [Coniochaeta sp. PMI_546]|nr:hypothetical protein BR93DRAFT_936515 [Coniochaeta sp. PMI_546]